MRHRDFKKQMFIESFSYEWEHCTVTVRYGYSRNFECFFRNYGTGTATVPSSPFPSHTKSPLMWVYRERRVRLYVF